MTTLRTVRYELRDLLATNLGIPVTASPARQTVTTRSVFFGPRTGSRETQGGGDLCTFPVYVLVPDGEDSQFDVLDDYIDGASSVIDLIDGNPVLPCGAAVAVTGEWSEQQVEIGGVTSLACVFDVEARW